MKIEKRDCGDFFHFVTAPSRAVLDSYANAVQRCNNLTEANRHYDERQKLKQNVADIGEQISKVFKGGYLSETFLQ